MLNKIMIIFFILLDIIIVVAIVADEVHKSKSGHPSVGYYMDDIEVMNTNIRGQNETIVRDGHN